MLSTFELLRGAGVRVCVIGGGSIQNGEGSGRGGGRDDSGGGEDVGELAGT